MFNKADLTTQWSRIPQLLQLIIQYGPYDVLPVPYSRLF